MISQIKTGDISVSPIFLFPFASWELKTPTLLNILFLLQTTIYGIFSVMSRLCNAAQLNTFPLF